MCCVLTSSQCLKPRKTSFYSSKHLTFLLIHVVPKMFCEMLLCFMNVVVFCEMLPFPKCCVLSNVFFKLLLCFVKCCVLLNVVRLSDFKLFLLQWFCRLWRRTKSRLKMISSLSAACKNKKSIKCYFCCGSDFHFNARLLRQ